MLTGLVIRYMGSPCNVAHRLATAKTDREFWQLVEEAKRRLKPLKPLLRRTLAEDTTGLPQGGYRVGTGWGQGG